MWVEVFRPKLSRRVDCIALDEPKTPSTYFGMAWASAHSSSNWCIGCCCLMEIIGDGFPLFTCYKSYLEVALWSFGRYFVFSILQPFMHIVCKWGILVVLIFILRWKYVPVKATSHGHSLIAVIESKHLTLLGTGTMVPRYTTWTGFKDWFQLPIRLGTRETTTCSVQQGSWLYWLLSLAIQDRCVWGDVWTAVFDFFWHAFVQQGTQP